MTWDQDAHYLAQQFFHAYVRLGQHHGQPDHRSYTDLSPTDKARLEETFLELLARGVVTAWPHRSDPTESSSEN